MDATKLEARYEAVAEAVGDLVRREEIRRGSREFSTWNGCARLSLDSAGPRDVRALAASLHRLPGLKTALTAMGADRWRAIAERLDTLDDMTALIERTLVEEPPLTLADGGVDARGVDPELDELVEISSTGRRQIGAIEKRERQRTGIGSLKVRYNTVFGYYIEITKQPGGGSGRLRAQATLVNAEWFYERRS